MLTVGGVVTEMGLELASGADAADRPIRWVHITELTDPTPWLSGGELVLTTGMRLRGAAAQRAFVRRLADHQLAGLGFGTGFDHRTLPAALVEEARAASFPVFEVPYELPFIAITELAFTRLVNEHFETLQRGIEMHKRLERIVLEERGLDDLVRALASAIAGCAVVLDARGHRLAAHAFRRPLPEDGLEAVAATIRQDAGAAPFAPDHPDLAGRALALPISHRRGTAQAWLVAARDGGGLGDFERLILQQAVTVVALELMRQRTMRETERRLAGDVLAEAVAGRLEPPELEARLHPFGIDGSAAVAVFALDDPHAAEGTLAAHLAETGVPALVATHAGLLCAVVDADPDDDVVALARAARAALARDGSGVRAGVSRPAPAGRLRRAFHEARCALEAAALGNGDAPEVATHADLGAFQLLLSLQEDEALRLYCDNVLGPLEQETGDYGDELVRSLEIFIEQNGNWERAARELFCHRHTLRYRIRRVEEITGRDLSRARDRIEFWLALRARELVR